MATRTETDSMGPIEVPDHQYWGAFSNSGNRDQRGPRRNLVCV